MNLLGWYENGEQLTTLFLNTLGRFAEVKIIGENAGGMIVCIYTNEEDYDGTYFELYDNGGEMNITRVNITEPHDSLPTTCSPQLAKPYTIATLAHNAVQMMLGASIMEIDFKKRIVDDTPAGQSIWSMR